MGPWEEVTMQALPPQSSMLSAQGLLATWDIEFNASFPGSAVKSVWYVFAIDCCGDDCQLRC